MRPAKKKICWMSWSTGKDSSFALMTCLNDSTLEVQGLFSTITKDFERVSMHSTRKILLEMQAKSLNLPLNVIEIPADCSNADYEKQMAKLIKKATEQKIDSMIFGDLFLDWIKDYRKEKLNNTGIEPLFPIWEYGTQKLANEFIDLGFKAIITCVDPKKLDKSFVGRHYDQSFIDDLPNSVDPCGEYGEFHTFVYDGPIFSFPIKCTVGETIEKNGFHFADILPV